MFAVMRQVINYFLWILILAIIIWLVSPTASSHFVEFMTKYPITTTVIRLTLGIGSGVVFGLGIAWVITYFGGTLFIRYEYSKLTKIGA